MKTHMITAMKFFLVMTLLAGIIYPILMTGIVQVMYPNKSNGSLISNDGKIVGSELIGQKFDSSIYFWSRPSANGYNPIPSGASNYGPTSDTLRKLLNARRNSFAVLNSINDQTTIPKEMLCASASGLDPHISPVAALLQVNRISEARHFSPDRKEKLIGIINRLTEHPQFAVFGEERINVLKLNMELDNIK
jgi:K+-transporting ATPase ATPase C chain